MKLKGVSFRHAVELLKDEPSLAAVADEPVKRTTVRALPAPVALDAPKSGVRKVEKSGVRFQFLYP